MFYFSRKAPRRVSFRLCSVLAAVVLLALADLTVPGGALALNGDCGQPTSFGPKSVTGDALSVLRYVVGLRGALACAPDCNATTTTLVSTTTTSTSTSTACRLTSTTWKTRPANR